MWEKINNGDDQNGKQLFDWFKDAVVAERDDKAPKGVLRSVNQLHRTAKEQVGNIDNPAEAVKLQNTLTEMYSAAHLGEYKVEIPEDTPEDQRIEVTKRQMIEDFTHFGEQAAKKQMDLFKPMCNCMVEFNDKNKCIPMEGN